MRCYAIRSQFEWPSDDQGGAQPPTEIRHFTVCPISLSKPNEERGALILTVLPTVVEHLIDSASPLLPTARESAYYAALMSRGRIDGDGSEQDELLENASVGSMAQGNRRLSELGLDSEGDVFDAWTDEEEIQRLADVEDLSDDEMERYGNNGRGVQVEMGDIRMHRRGAGGGEDAVRAVSVVSATARMDDGKAPSMGDSTALSERKQKTAMANRQVSVEKTGKGTERAGLIEGGAGEETEKSTEVKQLEAIRRHLHFAKVRHNALVPVHLGVAIRSKNFLLYCFILYRF